MRNGHSREMHRDCPDDNGLPEARSCSINDTPHPFAGNSRRRLVGDRGNACQVSGSPHGSPGKSSTRQRCDAVSAKEHRYRRHKESLQNTIRYNPQSTKRISCPAAGVHRSRPRCGCRAAGHGSRRAWETSICNGGLLLKSNVLCC